MLLAEREHAFDQRDHLVVAGTVFCFFEIYGVNRDLLDILFIGRKIATVEVGGHPLQAEIEETSRLAQSAIRLGPDDAFVLGLSGFAIFFVLGDVESGADYIERACALNPNLAILWGGAGLTSISLGHPAKGARQIEHAMRLSPLDPSMGLWQSSLAYAHFYEGRYEEAVSWAMMSLRSLGYARPTLAILAASQAFSGHTEDAAKAIARLRTVDPSYRLSAVPDLKLARRAQDRERLIEGLRLAGLPD